MILGEIKNMYIKNRLTEGVDFVRKEWLKGDGSAKISIIFNGWRETLGYTIQALDGVSGDYIYSSMSSIPNNTSYYEYRYFVGNSKELTLRHGIRILNPRAGYESFIIDSKKDGQYEGRIYNISLKKTDVNKVMFTINGSDFLKTGRFDSRLDFDVPMSIFAKAAKISAFNTDRYNLVPCQLLKSIPALLDANNIARSAGECGMYDSISGKFYGNVANSGTFTVEGDVTPETHSGLQQIYQNRLIEGVDYETADWLKGDGIINYDKPINYLSDNLRIKIRNLDSNSGYNTIWVGGDTNSGKNDWSRCIIDFEFVNGVSARQVQWCEYVYRNGYYQHFPTSSDNIYTFDININRAIINGVTYSMTSSRCNVTTPFVITLRKADSIAYCKLNNVDMYPCKLLKTIPRNLDAQCKERVAGECGMIDLISGKFYGNVASSGTFTVENDNNE